MCGRSEGYAQTGFSSFVRVVETCSNFQPGKACLNISKLKKKNVASNALSGISFPPGFFEPNGEKFDTSPVGRFSIFSDLRSRKNFHFTYYLQMFYSN